MRRYYEFAVVVILLSILALLLMQSLGRTRSDMEEAGVQVEAAVMRTELMEVLAHRETFGGVLPATDNPVEWVTSKPRNYRGKSMKYPMRRRSGISTAVPVNWFIAMRMDGGRVFA
ncbi:hypothetical protein [Dechloromonas sp. A34]|uniref:hypothetical protein n=1 Tax=Dechloromonas sp. A34 TaxID=447588 RepID=UPI002249076C|nr:hypothetical protein [Dechloromonas sp. A34]